MHQYAGRDVVVVATFDPKIVDGKLSPDSLNTGDNDGFEFFILPYARQPFPGFELAYRFIS